MYCATTGHAVESVTASVDDAATLGTENASGVVRGVEIATETETETERETGTGTGIGIETEIETEEERGTETGGRKGSGIGSLTLYMCI